MAHRFRKGWVKSVISDSLILAYCCVVILQGCDVSPVHRLIMKHAAQKKNILCKNASLVLDLNPQPLTHFSSTLHYFWYSARSPRVELVTVKFCHDGPDISLRFVFDISNRKPTHVLVVFSSQLLRVLCPSPGMNAAVRAVVRMGIYVGAKVYFIHEVSSSVPYGTFSRT